MDKEDYLKRILEFLVDDTIIDSRHTMVKLPYTPNHTINYKNLWGLYSIFDYHLSGEKQFYMFYDYCEGMYGLTKTESIILWGLYKGRIVEEIKLSGSINESVDNKEKYLDKIVQYILEDTEIDYEQKLVTYPFIPNTPSQWGLSVPLHYVQYESPFFKEYSKYCKDIYGLSYEESVYVWDRYVNISGLY